MNYSAGFYIAGDEVLLVRKTRGPEVLRGKLNAIGGKVDPEDSCDQACMSREFYEETGHDVTDWDLKGYLSGEDFTVTFLIYYGDKFDTPEYNDVGEKLDWYKLNDLPDDLVPNVKWLLPLCLSNDTSIWHLYEKSI